MIPYEFVDDMENFLMISRNNCSWAELSSEAAL